MALVHTENLQTDHSDDPAYLRINDYTRQVHSKASYFVSTNKRGEPTLTKIISVKLTGINRKSGKRWYRWQQNNMVSISRNKRGKYNVRYKMLRNFGGVPYYSSLMRDVKFNELFLETFGEVFRISTLYPIVEHYLGPDPEVEYLPIGFRPFLKEPDLYHLVCALFGKSRYRRDLARAVAKSHPPALMIARAFRGLVPIDYIVKFLQVNTPEEMNRADPPYYRYPHVDTTNLRKRLYQIHPSSYRHILCDMHPLQEQELRYINDINEYGHAIHGRHRSINSMHDQIGDLYAARHYEPREHEPIKITKQGQKILEQNAMLAPVGLHIELPESTERVFFYGQKMKNCIGGYAFVASKPASRLILGAIYDGERMIANFEINNGTLKQLLGPCNQHMRDTDREYIEVALTAAGITIPENYWGRPARIEGQRADFIVLDELEAV